MAEKPLPHECFELLARQAEHGDLEARHARAAATRLLVVWLDVECCEEGVYVHLQHLGRAGTEQ